jgi:hypothetical protein
VWLSYAQAQEVSNGAVQSIGRPTSHDGTKTHEGDVKSERGPKPKRIRLSEGEKLTLEAGPIIQKGHFIKTLLDYISSLC